MTGISARGKVGVRGVLITRKDGPIKGRYDIVLGTWEETDVILSFWAKTAPDNGYFDTCDFKVIFEDGNSYSGTYYLRQQDAFLKNLLPKHIHNICNDTKIAWAADEFLAKYDIPKAA